MVGAGLLVAVDGLFSAELQLVGRVAEHVEGFGSFVGEHPGHVVAEQMHGYAEVERRPECSDPLY